MLGFAVMRNPPISETELFSEGMELLRASLPDGWSVLRVESQPSLFMRPDAILEISGPDGARSTVLVEVRSSLEAFMVPTLVENWRLTTPDPVLVIAPFVSKRTQEALKAEGINYIDSTGRIRLELDRPALLIYVETGLKDSSSLRAFPGDRLMRTLRGGPATRIVRALCDFNPPYSPSVISRLAGTSPASVSRALALLEREGLIQKEPRGPVVEVDWEGLIRRWTEDYSFQSTNRARGFLAPRGVDRFMENLRDRGNYALTGSFAVPDEARTAPAVQPLVFVPSLIDALDAFDLRATETGHNVVLAEPFSPVLVERTREENSFTLCSVPQVAADLLTGPGRTSAEADGLFEWMRRNEGKWRLDPNENHSV